jgi:hypothetical protein
MRGSLACFYAPAQLDVTPAQLNVRNDGRNSSSPL